MEKKILFIVGSMRNHSFNRQLANDAKKMIGDKADVTFLDYRNIPFMNQDIEFPAPEEVARIRFEVEQADGIWIFTPEYNFSYPGVLKNLLDWLSRPLKQGDFGGASAISGRKVTFSAVAGRAAAKGSRAKLEEVLKLMRTDIMNEPVTAIAVGPETMMSDELVLTDDQKKELEAQIDAFLKFIG